MTTNGKPQASDLHVKLHELQFAAQRLDDFLQQVTVLSADIVDADTSVGVTVIRDGQPITVAASDDRTIHFDEVQYGAGEEPA